MTQKERGYTPLEPLRGSHSLCYRLPDKANPVGVAFIFQLV